MHGNAATRHTSAELHPSVRQAAQTREVEVLRYIASNYSRFNRCSPLVVSLRKRASGVLTA